MELIFIIGAVVVLYLVFKKKKVKTPDKYVVVTEQQTRQRVYKVPGGKK